jgi:hypothetical protein
MWREQLWETDLSVEACLSKVTSSTEKDTMFRGLGLHPTGTIFSSIEGNTFRLVAKGVPFVRNSFQPYFYGSVAKAGERTLIRGRFRMHRNVETFFGVWFAFVTVIGGIITIFALEQLITGRRILEGNMDVRAAAVTAPGMLVFTVALAWLGWWFGQGQRQCMELFIETTLMAHRLTSA